MLQALRAATRLESAEIVVEQDGRLTADQLAEVLGVLSSLTTLRKLTILCHATEDALAHVASVLPCFVEWDMPYREMDFWHDWMAHLPKVDIGFQDAEWGVY